MNLSFQEIAVLAAVRSLRSYATRTAVASMAGDLAASNTFDSKVAMSLLDSLETSGLVYERKSRYGLTEDGLEALFDSAARIKDTILAIQRQLP